VSWVWDRDTSSLEVGGRKQGSWIWTGSTGSLREQCGDGHSEA
jgi:hypothetical protein